MVWSVSRIAEAVKIVNNVITWSDVVRMVVTEDGTVPSVRTVRDINTKCYELLKLTFYRCWTFYTSFYICISYNVTISFYFMFDFCVSHKQNAQLSHPYNKMPSCRIPKQFLYSSLILILLRYCNTMHKWIIS